MTDGSLDFGQRKDVFHQLCHFGACEIFDLRGKTLNRAAQIAKAVGALGAFAFLQILLSILKTLQLVILIGTNSKERRTFSRIMDLLIEVVSDAANVAELERCENYDAFIDRFFSMLLED